jgi:glycosyltransferase involved in cell wall biosynthesis
LGIAERVEFLGRRTRLEVAQLLRESLIFVLPSRYEGLGCVYLEAMASGIPAIACEGQGIAEVIRHGENGFLVAENNWHALADVLRTLLTKPELRRTVGIQARQSVTEGFTLAHQAQRLRAIYAGCLV